MAIEWNKPVRKLKWKVRQLDINTRTTIQDITADNFEFEVQRVAEDSKFFGQVVCQKLNLKLREVGDNPYSTENYWKLYFREGSGSFEGKFPWFYTTEVHTDENTGMKSITAYDWIKRLENHTFSELNINPPYTIRQVAEAITHFDYSTRETLFINIDSATLNLNYPQGANFHGEEKLTDILAMIAEVLGAVCFVNVDNKLVFKRLDKSGEPVLEITKNDYFTFKSGENKRLAKIIYATELGDNVEAHTTALGSTQACRNNAFLDNRSDRMALVSSAINNYGGLTIGQIDLDWRANPDLEIGDKIAITAKDDTTITTYLLDEVVKWKNGLSSKMRFKWDQSKESDESANPATIGDAFNTTYAKVDKINNTIELVVAEQEETSQELSGVKDDLTSTKTQVNTNKNNIASLTLTTSGLELNVQNLENKTETIETTISNISVGGRNLFIAHTRRNNKSIHPDTGLDNSWGHGFASDFMPVEAGVSYIIQFWQIPKPEAQSEGISWGLYFYDTDKNWIAPRYARVISDKTYDTFTRKAPTGACYARFYWHIGGNFNATTWNPYGDYKVKFEKGTKPTDWSIAPEDIDSDITVVKTDIATTQTQVQTNKEDIASLEVTTNGISQTVSNHTSSINSMNTTLSTVQTTANNAKDKADTLETSLNSVSSQVTTNKNNIATLQTTTDGITASVSDLQTAQQTLTTTVDNLSVGGRNLFIAKNRANNKYINNDGVAGSWEKTILSDWIDVNPSTNYTVQVWQVPKTQAEIDDGESASFVIAQYDSSKAFISGTRRGNICSTLNYKKDAFKTKTNASYIRIHYHFGGPEASADWNPYGIHKIKVEEGNMPTGWSIAPEDVDSRITANTNTASGIRNDLTSTQTQVTTNKNNIATLQTTTSSISANVSSLEETTTTLTTEMENMKIGARNLFIAKARTNDKFQKADGTTPTWAKTVMSDYISAEAGETYIAQAWKPANTSATGDNRGYIRFASYNASKSLLGLSDATGGNTPNNTSYFTGDYYWFKLKAPTNTKFIRVIYHFGIDGPAGEDWDMFGDFKVKVEHGTKATEWSPAPEDMVDVIDRQYNELSSSFTMTTNQINSSVQQLTNNTTAVQTALNEYKSSNNSAIDDINGDIASVRQATELLQSKSEVQASVITELQNSQGKATQVTTTTATLNDSGLTVQKSSSTISTTISENGMQVKDGSTVELSANSQGVVAHNLSADNYLIVDNMIRWQKYGSNRIGCYWIGG